MRQVFFLLSGLLICLISSCTKENVSSFDDKFLQKWNVETSVYQRIGVDTVFEETWASTDTTSISYEFRSVSAGEVSAHWYEMIIDDENLNVIPGKPDTLNGFWEKVDNDLLIIGEQAYKINFLTNLGMELEATKPFSSNPLFHTEQWNIHLAPSK